MLGRSAANLFWMSRYIERAEYVARLLDAGYRMSLTPGLDAGHRDQWGSVLDAASLGQTYAQKNDSTDQAGVVNFMLFDQDNPSSVHSCLMAARTNARSERIRITKDMWESINSIWLEFSAIKPALITSNKLPELLDWIKSASNQFRGALLGTILRHDNYQFSQLGCFVERADNTARLLDVKYYVLLPRSAAVGGEVDTHQWTMILRAVSAERSYRHMYHDQLRPTKIAEYLILKAAMPRSLRHAYDWINSTFKEMEQFYGERADCHQRAQEILDTLKQTTIEEVIDTGLHEFLEYFTERNNQLSQAVAVDYNF